MYRPLSENEKTIKKPRKPRKQSWSQHSTHEGIKYRSSWEVFISKVLKAAKIPFLFEPKRFFLQTGISYLPDFFIPSKNLFIEVKGWMRTRDALKIKLFAEKFPHKIIVFNEKEISFILGLPASTLAKTNLRAYTVNQGQIDRLLKLLSGV